MILYIRLPLKSVSGSKKLVIDHETVTTVISRGLSQMFKIIAFSLTHARSRVFIWSTALSITLCGTYDNGDTSFYTPLWVIAK